MDGSYNQGFMFIFKQVCIPLQINEADFNFCISCGPFEFGAG